MKTKIIYISGSEVFEMSDVRAAFEEVRATLGLKSDTILFGVPVDSDDAIAKPDIAATQPQPQDAVTTVTEPDPIIEEPDAMAPVEEIIEPEIPVMETPAEIPVPVKKSRGRPRKVAEVKKEDTPAEIDEQPVTAPTAAAEPEKVIPILSVLASGSETNEDTTAAPENVFPEQIEESQAASKDMADAPAMEIEDMIADDVPETPVEKTLEQLLESMAPLREDHNDAANTHTRETAVDTTDDTEPLIVNDTDATLEKLAAEFANTEDKIPSKPMPQNHGKIGKLKNILPFKKARREDTGLMGDLFGWAGVAANDEDFSIPGFFTTAAKK